MKENLKSPFDTDGILFGLLNGKTSIKGVFMSATTAWKIQPKKILS